MNCGDGFSDVDTGPVCRGDKRTEYKSKAVHLLVNSERKDEIADMIYTLHTLHTMLRCLKCFGSHLVSAK